VVIGKYWMSDWGLNAIRSGNNGKRGCIIFFLILAAQLNMEDEE